MEEAAVDLNADLGESFGRWQLGDDEALLPLVSSANVACGFHAGDPVVMRRTCQRAAALGVAVGAQVSYRDLAGFGRRFIDVPPEELEADVVYQIGALQAFARAAGTSVRYVKPHGALYHAVVRHEGQAGAVVRAVLSTGGLPLLGLPGSSLLAQASEAGVRAVTEFFADRGYGSDGTLVPRDRPGALFDDAAAVAARVVQVLRDGTVTSVDGATVAVTAQSVCLHGDTPGAVEHARAVRAALEAEGVAVRPFAEIREP